GRILLAPNIAGFDATNVLDAFEKALGVAVMIENDVNLAVLGENWLGQGQGIDNLAYIALGTGVGSGLMLGGHLVRGATHAAGEIGFMPIGADPFAAESLRTGAFERAVATHAMTERYRSLTGAQVAVPAIFENAATGDKAALTVLDETARYLAQGIAAIAAVANPEKVILGGSIGLRPEILSRVKDLMPLCFPYPVTVEAGELGARAALIGAAAIGLGQLHNTLFGVDAPDGRISLPTAQAAALKEVVL
ncbi:ROK family protein, partial [Mesorhizobium sp.]